MSTNANAARKPAASRKAVAPAAPAATDAVVAPVVGAAPDAAPDGGWPAADNGAAWLALIVATVPAIDAARAHKYGDGKGLLPVAATRYVLTPFGREAVTAGGKGKSGKFTVQALLCVAHGMAQAATGDNNPCGAAVAYFAYTAPVLALLQPPHTKTARYVGKPAAGAYNVPCPRWLSDYMRGNARTPALLFGIAG